MAEVGFFRVLKKAAKDIDLGFRQGATQADTFVGHSDEEASRPGSPEGGSHFGCAQAVSISLNDRCADSASQLLLETAIVFLNGRKINRQDTAGSGGRINGHQA